MKKIIYSFFLVLISSLSYTQENLFDAIEFKNIGPTIMSGRVVDVAVNPSNVIEFYVAYASGGLWYTNNNGNSFIPVLDSAPTQNCGTVSVDWNSGTIWVGTGEVNSSRSSYAGVGVLQSSDKGKTWKNIGLTDSHHISRIIVNPKNNKEITVGAVGHLYTKNEERGIFKTIDGGLTWKKTLFIDDESGVIDVVTVPNNYSIQYASVWQKDRKAWSFKGNGASSAIYKSTDGGLSWQCITPGENGFPHNEEVGRIGLASFDENVIYAVVDNQNKRPFVKKPNPKDANSALFETDVVGCEVYKSENGGQNWVKTNVDYIDDMFYSYGYYFANITVDVKNSKRVYIGGFHLLFSEDGGKTFGSIDKENVHADHHFVWVNPNNQNHIINGNDGGVNITYDNGSHWYKCNNQAVGQFYAINVDDQEPYNVYGGLQDNGVWVGPSDYIQNLNWQSDGKYPYTPLIEGDGMQVQIDKRNPNIVITGSQFGNYSRIDRAKKTEKKITPKPARKEDNSFRFNWQTPVLLSSHNQDILYMGSNFLHRSMNQGDTWDVISSDLTQGKKEGNIAYGTITTIAESSLQFGLLYAGSDDGLLHLSKDGGSSWAKISDNLPQNFWVSRVVASCHKKERVYVTLNGYRNDDFTPMVYVSEDFGKTWKNISFSLPRSPVNVILEDIKNENILYLGTDNDLFISIDKGLSWSEFSAGIPSVAIHDLVIQKKSNDLLVGTHGRSIYKTNIEKVQSLTNENLKKELLLYDVPSIKRSKKWGEISSAWEKPNEPKVEIWFYSSINQKTILKIFNIFNQIVFSKEIQAKQGLNKVEYDYSISKENGDIWMKNDKTLKFEQAESGKYYLPVSKCKIIVSNGKTSSEKELEITESKK
ncbi:MAG: glycosyl hydrolase [Bacteroidota bacterium]